VIDCIDVGQSSKVYEVVVGLEVHAQVLARTKLFSEGKTLFNSPPNSQVSVIDAALPGVMPCTNEKVVQQAVCKITLSPLMLTPSIT
jgi:Asp-tRNA(Asn)/Glu-tRNA(Gln) amidotransferase B subunit